MSNKPTLLEVGELQNVRRPAPLNIYDRALICQLNRYALKVGRPASAIAAEFICAALEAHADDDEEATE